MVGYAGAGTVTVTNSSAAVVGSGTTFTTTFCQGPANPDRAPGRIPRHRGLASVRSGDGTRDVPGDVLRRRHAPDDRIPYNDDGKTLPGSGLSYAADNQYAPIWGWSKQESPGELL